ncbi:MAG: CHAP domain-containing protein [Blastocatellia bacterium]
MLCLLPISASAQNNWWNANINYRVPLTVETVGGTAQSQSVTVGVNFTSTLQAVSNRRPVNADALRVVEVDSAGKVIDDNVDTQFERAANYHPVSNAQGKLRFWLKAGPQSTRYFYLYFDTTTSATPRLIAKRETGVRAPDPVNDLRSGAPLVSIGELEDKVSSRNRRVVPELTASDENAEPSPLRPNWLAKPEHQFFGGYCTWYAARKWKEFTGAPVTWSGDAGRWFDHAAEEGRKVSSDPQAAVRGAVVVWTRAHAAGHVAFVEAVTDDGIFISEMNARGLWVVSEAFLPFTNLDKGTKYKFKGYVLPE